MRTNFELKHAAAETRPCEDPFSGFVWRIRRIGSRRYQDHLQAAIKQAGLQRAAAGKAAGIDVCLDDIDADALASSDGVALLIDGIDGLEDEDGSPMEYTEEIGRHLLGLDLPVEWAPWDSDKNERTETGWMTLGTALRAWVLEEASNGQKYLDAFKERAGKNSGGPSDSL